MSALPAFQQTLFHANWSSRSGEMIFLGNFEIILYPLNLKSENRKSGVNDIIYDVITIVLLVVNATILSFEQDYRYE